jgi:hypothetical protein
LRINCDRLHRFADISAVEGFLRELEAWSAGALVVELPRAPGMRETRWAHLLAGPPAAELMIAAPVGAGAAGDGVAPSELAALRESVAALQQEVASLRAELARLADDVRAAPAREPPSAT